MRWLELNSENVVVNIVVWDGVSPYSPEGITQLLPCSEHPNASYGWRLVDNVWVTPDQTDPSETEI